MPFFPFIFSPLLVFLFPVLTLDIELGSLHIQPGQPISRLITPLGPPQGRDLHCPSIYNSCLVPWAPCAIGRDHNLTKAWSHASPSISSRIFVWLTLNRLQNLLMHPRAIDRPTTSFDSATRQPRFQRLQLEGVQVVCQAATIFPSRKPSSITNPLTLTRMPIVKRLGSVAIKVLMDL